MFRRRSPPRFKRSAAKPRRRLSDWWLLWRVPTLLLIVMAVWWFGFRPIQAEQGWVRETRSFPLCGAGSGRAAGCVVDGDTLMIGFGSERRRVRFTGFDAPERDGVCEAERQLAEAARVRLQQWLAQGSFEWSGADEPPRDQYGRELREAWRTARDGSREYLSETMIQSGLAAENGWGAAAPDWCD
ncbi:thermonuclease family protein [Qipengyuania sp. ASV99]|uniref:thermonuclease family protein n=1 Tax=Qipengyuania sp. ASV99 TaxID=3399681 RepID=UPI003A4C7DEE